MVKPNQTCSSLALSSHTTGVVINNSNGTSPSNEQYYPVPNIEPKFHRVYRPVEKWKQGSLLGPHNFHWTFTTLLAAYRVHWIHNFLKYGATWNCQVITALRYRHHSTRARFFCLMTKYPHSRQIFKTSLYYLCPKQKQNERAVNGLLYITCIIFQFVIQIQVGGCVFPMDNRLTLITMKSPRGYNDLLLIHGILHACAHFNKNKWLLNNMIRITKVGSK